MLTQLFERAAIRAGWRDARAGIPFHENPFTRGALARFERHWGRGWAAANECPRPWQVQDWEQGICTSGNESTREAA
ncbi:hypothetical protein [Burkholderia aenigmatica]|uniref:hypothetical protein n=1 Tax=Burkholderia aenigmatica TaxID=2015348 RepID=UPI00158143D1|nr:hypothetical protein [Burkholderia aenigmatica]